MVTTIVLRCNVQTRLNRSQRLPKVVKALVPTWTTQWWCLIKIKPWTWYLRKSSHKSQVKLCLSKTNKFLKSSLRNPLASKEIPQVFGKRISESEVKWVMKTIIGSTRMKKRESIMKSRQDFQMKPGQRKRVERSQENEGRALSWRRSVSMNNHSICRSRYRCTTMTRWKVKKLFLSPIPVTLVNIFHSTTGS